jgi:hypothetical protein
MGLRLAGHQIAHPLSNALRRWNHLFHRRDGVDAQSLHSNRRDDRDHNERNEDFHQHPATLMGPGWLGGDVTLAVDGALDHPSDLRCDCSVNQLRLAVSRYCMIIDK